VTLREGDSAHARTEAQLKEAEQRAARVETQVAFTGAKVLALLVQKYTY
jgi:hypothetical protein